MRGLRLAGGLLSLILCSASVHATTAQPADQDSQATPGPQAESAPPVDNQQPASKKWEFATIGYVWLAGAWGKTDVIGPVEPVDLDLPFGKVLKAFKFAFMGAAEARRDRFVVMGDMTFIHLDASEGIGIRDPDFLEAELDSRTAEITALGGYRVVDDDAVKVDLLGGGRMNWFKTTLQLQGPNRELEGDVKKSWFDPLFAARVAAPLGGKWGIAVYGDALEALDVLDIDQQRRRGNAKIHCRNKALAASQHHCIGVACQHGDGVPEGPRSLIPKQRRLHTTSGPHITRVSATRIRYLHNGRTVNQLTRRNGV